MRAVTIDELNALASNPRAVLAIGDTYVRATRVRAACRELHTRPGICAAVDPEHGVLFSWRDGRGGLRIYDSHVVAAGRTPASLCDAVNATYARLVVADSGVYTVDQVRAALSAFYARRGARGPLRLAGALQIVEVAA